MPHLNRTGRRCRPCAEMVHSLPADEELAQDGRVLLTVEQFMDLYGFGRTKTYELLNDGELEAVKAGSRTLIKRASADAFVARLPSYSAEKRAA